MNLLKISLILNVGFLHECEIPLFCNEKIDNFRRKFINQYIIFIKLCLFWIFKIAEKCQIAYITYAYKTFYLKKLGIIWGYIRFWGKMGIKRYGMHPISKFGDKWGWE
jgi:hypothetical protein